MRVDRFLNSESAALQQLSVSSESDNELLLENRSLYERVAALQRTERDLLAENQDLERQFGLLKQNDDARQRQLREEFREREKTLEAHIRKLRKQIHQQEEQMTRIAIEQSKELTPLLSDDQIVSWFDDQNMAWHIWAKDFAHKSPNRLKAGGSLHPLQLRELCGGIKEFVRLQDDGGLPEELLTGGAGMVQVLLHAMLVNFIFTETLASPFWVFNAMSLGTLESPFLPPNTSTPLDLAQLKHKDVAASLRTTFFPPRSPGTTSHNSLFPPPLHVNTSLASSLALESADLVLPTRVMMENLHRLFLKAQEDSADLGITAHQYRAALMRLLAESGFSTAADSTAAPNSKNEARRMLIDSRLNYTRRLKERFLSGAARFLLQNQDPSGIERLELRLARQIDDALRFSCQIWSLISPIRLIGWKELQGKEFTSLSEVMTLCNAQAPTLTARAVQSQGGGSRSKHETPPPGYHDGRPVVVVVQPAVEALATETMGDGFETDSENVSRVWTKARVLVAGPVGQLMSRSAEVAPASPPLSRKDSPRSSLRAQVEGSSSEELPAKSYDPSANRLSQTRHTKPPRE
ncbi:hypothetical protein B0T17DRAFT_487861 [Bombardia bombarda]|uniref:Uncharacterized protein n=1 Tax=Bombardia bombarda TaxID=252184 RepID=A0AA40C9E2_9PEZI|nr:hypothetical protein B0T17DRAFT_487861 [Bombardia bombarda]